MYSACINGCTAPWCGTLKLMSFYTTKLKDIKWGSLLSPANWGRNFQQWRADHIATYWDKNSAKPLFAIYFGMIAFNAAQEYHFRGSMFPNPRSSPLTVYRVPWHGQVPLIDSDLSCTSLMKRTLFDSVSISPVYSHSDTCHHSHNVGIAEPLHGSDFSGSVRRTLSQ